MPTYSISGPTIPAGESLSNAVDCSASRIIRIVMPQDGWDSAPLTFQLSTDGTAFSNLYNIQTIVGGFQQFEVAVPAVEPGTVYIMPPNTGEMIGFVRFRSGTKDRPMVQTADRKFQLVLA